MDRARLGRFRCLADNTRRLIEPKLLHAFISIYRPRIKPWLVTVFTEGERAKISTRFPNKFVAVTANGTVDAEQITTLRALPLGKCTSAIVVKTASANEKLQKTQIILKRI